jgi:hypothetical protein
MKVIRTIGSGLQFEAEADSQKGLFESLAAIDQSYVEVFGEKECGVCGNQDLRFKFRDVEYDAKDEKTGEVLIDKKSGQPKKKKSRYYEIQCGDWKCRAVLPISQHQEGNTLYPKRKEKNSDKWNPNNGWKLPPKKKDAPQDDGENLETSTTVEKKPF